MADHAPALSFIQPWLSGGILRFGKRIENRVAWRACKHRGPVWLHASQTAGRAFDECAFGLRSVLLEQDREQEWERFVGEHLALTRRGEPRYCTHTLPLGAIAGHARIVDVIAGRDDFERWVDEGVTSEREAQRAWWFGGFALVLADVVEIEPVPCKGALGLWRVPEQIEADARAALEKAVPRG